ncbi:hypothetical protein AAEP93_003337 [Penicillium crustosum]
MARAQSLLLFCVFILQAVGGSTINANRIQNDMFVGEILESPNFPAPALPKGVSTKRRDALLECDFTNGIAFVGPTAENIKHLQIEQKKMCVAEPN